MLDVLKTAGIREAMRSRRARVCGPGGVLLLRSLRFELLLRGLQLGLEASDVLVESIRDSNDR